MCWSGKGLRGCCTGRGFVRARGLCRDLPFEFARRVVTDAGVVSCGKRTLLVDEGVRIGLPIELAGGLARWPEVEFRGRIAHFFTDAFL